MVSFLIIKTSAIGDIIQSFLALDYLRSRFPQARIDWVVEATSFQLVSSHPAIDQVFSVDTKKWRRAPFSKQTFSEILEFKKKISISTYDLVFDLQGNIKSALLSSLVRAHERVGFGFNSVAEKPNLLATTKRYEISKSLNARERYLCLLQSYFQDKTSHTFNPVTLKIVEEERVVIKDFLKNMSQMEGKPHFLIAFGSKWFNKRLDPHLIVSFLKLVQKELSPRLTFIFSNEEEKQEALNLEKIFSESGKAIGGLSLPVLQNLIDQIDCVIAVDSAVLHLAGTTKTATFSIFGPSLASIYKPLGDHHEAYSGSCPYKISFPVRCPKLRTCATGACIKNLHTEDLFKAFKAFWIEVISKQFDGKCNSPC